MKLSKSLIVPITAAFSILLSGCAYTTTSNTFSYHGTDLQNTSEPFSYVEKNIVGSAETAHTWRGGGNTRNGLIADAFENLNNQFKLDVNQALANVAIDLMEVESGIRTPLLLALFSGVSYVPSDFTTIVSIRVDVIEFGSNSPWALEEAGLVRILNEGPINKEPRDNQHSELGSNSRRSFGEGDKVKVMISGKLVEGLVLWTISDSTGTDYKVQFLVDGKKKSKFFSGKDVFDLDEK